MAALTALLLPASLTIAQPGYSDQSLPPPIYDEDVLHRLEQTGLVVLPDATSTNLYSCYYELEMSGRPVYVTADAMLYLWYEAHRQALMVAEKEYLRPQLALLAERLLAATQQQRAAGDDPLLRENAVMLEVVWALLEPSHQPDADLAADVDAELTRVREHTVVELYPGEDYTQYEVRGYYTRNADLSNYFRGAKYLARRYFRVADPGYPADAERELRRALLLAMAMRTDPGLIELYRQIVDLRVFLCGPIDTIGLDQLISAASVVWGDGWGREKLTDLSALQRELQTEKYPTSRINTRVTDPDIAMMPPSNVAILGEHYLPDCDLFHQTTEPQVPRRHLPSGLDVATALGSPLAAEKLREETAAFPQVVPNAQSFGKQMKLEGIYGSWLQTLRTLFEQPEGLPDFAKTTTYEEKQLNCCLTSWAHLRHNYILYGAQAYTCGGGASPSPGIVEPLPGFFAAYARMCRDLREELVARGIEGRVLTVLDSLEKKATTFKRCAEDQLAGRDTSWARDDIHFFGGFIMSVYFDTPLLAADVATSSETREVLHAASGPFHKVLARYSTTGGQPVIAQGWVGSYYEFAEPEFGRVTDEQWQERLQRQYDSPLPPEWLAGLYQPRPGERAGQRQELREIERLLAADNYDEAAQAAEAFITREQDTEWAPRAVLLLGDYLAKHKRREESLAMYERTRPMYGCDARDEALRRIREHHSGQGRAAWEERQAEQERQFAAQLAATDPREGLTDAEEIERQNERAGLLLGRADLKLPGILKLPDDHFTRIIKECPRSGYVPYAEFAAIIGRLSGEGEGSTGGEPDPDTYREVRAELLALADKYSDSAVGQSARVAACWMLVHLGHYEIAYQELGPLLGLHPPRPEPYPLSVKVLEDGGWSYGSPSSTIVSAPDLAREVLAHVIPHACRAGDLQRVYEYIALPETHPSMDAYGGWGELAVIAEYLREEPEPLRVLLTSGLIIVPGSDYLPAEGVQPDVDAVAGAAFKLADQYPRSKAAPAALFFAGERLLDRPEHEQLRVEARRRLSEQYPDSLENLIAQLNVAAERDDFTTYENLARKLRTRVPARDDFEATTYPHLLIDDLSSSRAPKPSPGADVLAQWKQRYGRFITEANLGDEALLACKTERKLVEELLKRLPDHELAIVLTVSEADERYVWSRLVEPALERHPTDPLAYELRFRRGSTEDMAAIIAAGPETPHFQEAVERFLAWQPADKYQRSPAADLYDYRQLAARHAGTPAEPLCGAVMAAIYLHYERPEQAIEFLDGRLAAIPEGILFRDRLLAAQENACGQIRIKRASAQPPLWTVPLQSGEDPYAGDTTKPGLALAPAGSRIYACGVLPDIRDGIAALDGETGRRLWETPCPDLVCLEPTGEDIIFSTGHGTVGRMEGRTGELLWETPLGLAQAGKAVVSVAGDMAAVAWDQGLLLGLDLATGSIRWHRDEHVDSTRILPDSNGDVPVAAGPGLFCAWDREDALRAWRLADGQPLWSLPVAEVLDQSADQISGGHSLLWPVTCGGQILSGTSAFEASAIVRIDPATGKIVWRKPFPGEVSLMPAAMRHNSAVFLYGQKQIVEWALADGTLRWVLPVPGEEDQEPPFAVAGDYALFVAEDLRVVDRRTGQIVARQPLTGAGRPRSIVAIATPDGLRAIVATKQDVRAYAITIPD